MVRQISWSTPTLGALALVACTGAASADRMAECRKNVSPDAQARACSNVIDSAPGRETLALAWAFRGAAYARKGMAPEAAENFAEALKVNPALKQAWLGRGMAHLSQLKFDAAIVDYSKAIEMAPDDAATYVLRGYAYLAKKEPQNAISDFTRCLILDPASVSALNNRGLAYRKLGKTKRAIADYTKAVQINPLYALAYNNRGYAHEALGNKAQAVDDFRNALAIDPSLVGARDALVRLSAASTIAAQSTKRVAAGRALAEKTCGWCHAIGRRGDSPNKAAPPFRDIHARHPVLALREPISRAIATPHDRMPQLSLSNAEIDQMIAYINSLRPAR